MNNSDLKWYPVYTNPRAEKSVCVALEQKRIICFLPLKKTLKQWSDRKKWVLEPLFSSYIFVRIKAHEQAEVLMTKGISRFIYFSGKIAAMPDRQMDELRLWLGAELPYETIHQPLEKGQQVEVVAGSLKGQRAELINFHGEKRVILRIDSIGYALLVQAPKGFVQGLSSF